MSLKHKANTTELHPKVRQTCVLIIFESLGTPKTAKMSFSGVLKFGTGVIKLALKYFMFVFGPTFFRRPVPYSYAGKVSNLDHP